MSRALRGCAPILASALAACASSGLPVEGAWQSNRELTLAGLRAAGRFSEEQWEVLEAPGLFGHMLQVYRGDRSVRVFEGRCGPTVRFEVLASGSDFVTLRYYDPLFAEAQTVRMDVEGDRLLVPMEILEGRAREVFTRVPLDEVLGRYPCVDALAVGEGEPSLGDRLRAATALEAYGREEYLERTRVGERELRLLRSAYLHFGSEPRAAASLLLALHCAQPPPGPFPHAFLHRYRCGGGAFEPFAVEALRSFDRLYALAFARTEDRERARTFLLRYLGFWEGERSAAEGGLAPSREDLARLEAVVDFLQQGGWPEGTVVEGR